MHTVQPFTSHDYARVLETRPMSHARVLETRPMSLARVLEISIMCVFFKLLLLYMSFEETVMRILALYGSMWLSGISTLTVLYRSM
jgi:hypothetical protein